MFLVEQYFDPSDVLQFLRGQLLDPDRALFVVVEVQDTELQVATELIQRLVSEPKRTNVWWVSNVHHVDDLE